MDYLFWIALSAGCFVSGVMVTHRYYQRRFAQAPRRLFSGPSRRMELAAQNRFLNIALRNKEAKR